MKLYTDEFLKGIEETLTLYKSGENIFDMGHSSLFPNISSQTIWKFSKGGNNLRLSDGNHVYNFTFPDGESDENDFSVIRGEDIQHNQFVGSGHKTGIAQVHRADPGSIYFTIQEGSKNPTYTLRHIGGDKWRATPKKKKVSKTKATTVNIPDSQVGSMKQGMAEELSKVAGFFSDMGHLGGQALTRGLNLGQSAILAPGRNPLVAAGLGAAGGAAYHFGKKHLYNTPEENAQESPYALLTRMLVPAAGLGALGGIERNMLSKPPGGHAGYYDQAANGHTPVPFETSGPMVNPFHSLFNQEPGIIE